MGFNAAMMASKVIHNSYEVMSVELISLVQAIDYLGIASKLSTYSQRIYNDVRKLVPVFQKDDVMYERTGKIKEFLKATRITI
jgi:histidine ammonia-lyase